MPLQAAPRVQWSACVSYVRVSTGPWPEPSCWAGAAGGGRRYCGRCSAWWTLTQPGSTCASPDSVWLWVSKPPRVHAGKRGIQNVRNKNVCCCVVDLLSCTSAETTCSTSASWSSRWAATNATTASSRKTPSSVNVLPPVWSSISQAITQARDLFQVCCCA